MRYRGLCFVTAYSVLGRNYQSSVLTLADQIFIGVSDGYGVCDTGCSKNDLVTVNNSLSIRIF